MTVLDEAKLVKETKLYTSKLNSIKNHLKALLEKKARLDFEILSLKKTLKNRELAYKKQLKLSVSLEELDYKNIINLAESLQKEDFDDLDSAILELSETKESLQKLLDHYGITD